MNSREIEYIITVAEEGNITRAAQKLFIAQPSLSQCIKKVEAQLGAELFVRTKDGLSLTYAGKIFLDAGTRIMKTYRDLESHILDVNDMKAGKLVLGTPFLLGSQILPGLYKNYHNKYPNIEISIIEDTSLALEELLLKGTIDLAILPLPFKFENIKYESILTCPMVLCAPPESELLAGVDPLTRLFDISLLNNQPFIMGNPGQRIRQAVDFILQTAGITVKNVVLTRSIETAVRLSQIGLGFTILPQSYYEHYSGFFDKNYYYIDSKYCPEWTITVAYTEGNYLSKAARMFIEESKAHCWLYMSHICPKMSGAQCPRGLKQCQIK